MLTIANLKKYSAEEGRMGIERKYLKETNSVKGRKGGGEEAEMESSCVDG